MTGPPVGVLARRPVLCALVMMLVSCPSAQAAQVSAGSDGSVGLFDTVPGGETNNVRVTQTATQVVFDDDVILTTGTPACTAAGGDVTCPAPPATVPFPISLDLREGNDQTTFTNVTVHVRQAGGPGDDVLRGTSGTTYVLGEAGNDQLTGGRGSTTGSSLLDGGAGSDMLLGGMGPTFMLGGQGADVFMPGPSFDSVQYLGDFDRDPASTVIASIDGQPDDGAVGEADNVMPGIEELVGTNNDDVLTGGTGAEAIRGLLGNDRIEGGPGADRLDGGDGNDEVRAVDGTADTLVSCGAGIDAAFADALDASVTQDCEQVTRSGQPVLGQPGNPQPGQPGNPEPPVPSSSRLPAPQVGLTVNVRVVRGRVRVRPPGARAFVLLSDPRQLPTGSTLDTRSGRLELIVATGTGSRTEKAEFYDGVFRVTQTVGARPVTKLQLTERLARCPATRAAGARAAATKKRPKRKRRLWGDGKGRFETTGKYGSAINSGTLWLTEDTCAGTSFTVRRGVIRVRRNGSPRSVRVSSGRKYVVRARR